MSSKDLPPYETLVRWTVNDVLDWLRTASLLDLKDTFRMQNIDGAKLAKLADSDVDEFKCISRKKRELLKTLIANVDRSRTNQIPKGPPMKSWQSNVPSSRPPAPLPSREREPAPPPRPAPAPPAAVHPPPSPSAFDDDPYDIGWSDNEFSDEDDQEDYENLAESDPEDYENLTKKGQAGGEASPPHVPRRPPAPPPAAAAAAGSAPPVPPPARRGATSSPSQVPETPAPPPPRSRATRPPAPPPEDSQDDDEDYVQPVEPTPASPRPRVPPGGRRPPPPPQPEPTPPPPRPRQARPPAHQPSQPPQPPPSRRARPPTPPQDQDIYEEPDPEPEPERKPIPSSRSRRLPPPPVVEERDELADHKWYQGSVQRQKAEEMMMSLNMDGMYVVRKSQKSATQPYTLMIQKDGRVYNLPVRLRPDKKYALGKEKPQEPSFPSVPAMIDYFKQRALVLNPAKGDAGQTPLVHPLPSL